MIVFVGLLLLAGATTAKHECMHSTVMKHTKIGRVQLDYGESNVEKRDLKEVNAEPLRVHFDVDELGTSPNHCIQGSGPATVTIMDNTFNCSDPIYFVSQVRFFVRCGGIKKKKSKIFFFFSAS